jgi:hypothetical protein
MVGVSREPAEPRKTSKPHRPFDLRSSPLRIYLLVKGSRNTTTYRQVFPQLNGLINDHYVYTTLYLPVRPGKCADLGK